MSHLKFLLFIILHHMIYISAITFEESILAEGENFFKDTLKRATSSRFTVPGTKWCGPGNTANGYDDLGSESEVDSCCRAHDHCKEILEPGETLYGLQNPDWFPRLKCACEDEFFNCLQKINKLSSKMLKYIYFNTREYCFNYGYPILSCAKYKKSMLSKRCVKYKVNESQLKIWQFYNNPL